MGEAQSSGRMNPHRLTTKQKKALALLALKGVLYYLFDGGARSGKTFVVCYAIIYRCIKYAGTRHLIGRYRFNHCRASVWTQTLIPLLKAILPPGSWRETQTPTLMIVFANGSAIWCGGFDDAERTEKIFGQEYATIFLNEATQIGFQTFQDIKTRLQWKGVPLLFIADCNPRNPAHWLFKTFIQKRDFEGGGELFKKKLYKRLSFSPYDNKANLNVDYIKNNLETLTGAKRRRLLDGIWCDSAEGAVFNFSRKINHVDSPPAYLNGVPNWAGWDFGVQADTFIVWFHVMSVPPSKEFPLGVMIVPFDEYVNNNVDYQYYKDVVKAKNYLDTRHAGDPAGKQRGPGKGLPSWKTLLAEKPDPIILETPAGNLSREDMIAHANRYIHAVRCSEISTPLLVECFENWTRKKDKDGKVVEGSAPEHDVYSHRGTAFYYALAVALPILEGTSEVRIY